jgi:hypothetical protein
MEKKNALIFFTLLKAPPAFEPPRVAVEKETRFFMTLCFIPGIEHCLCFAF